MLAIGASHLKHFQPRRVFRAGLFIWSNKMERIGREALATLLTSRGFPVTCHTLATFASNRTGPPYEIFGKRALYCPDAAFDWARARMTTPQCGSHAA